MSCLDNPGSHHRFVDREAAIREMSVKILLLRTHYPHWGAFSGINQVLKYIDRNRCSVEECLVSDSDEQFPIKNEWVRYLLRRAVQKRGMQWYKLSDLVAEINVFRRCRSGPVDIVHYLDGEHSAQFFPEFRKWLPGPLPKIVATYHQPPELLDSVVIRKMIPKLDYILVVSPEQISYFKELVGMDKIRIIRHGINTDFFRPEDKPRGNRKFRCVTVGHHLRDFDAIRKVAKALSKYDGIEFHIVTGQPTALEGLDNVTIHRSLEDRELLACYQHSDILFLPLIQTTANNALLEGIACGLPVVSTVLPAVQAYLSGNEAILVKNNDPKDLADAILYLFHNPTEREIRSKEARKRALELDWRNIAPEYERVYSELVTAKP